MRIRCFAILRMILSGGFSVNLTLILLPLLFALAAGLSRKEKRSFLPGLICLGLYLLCEIAETLILFFAVKNHMAELLLLYLGSISLGLGLGWITAKLIQIIKEKRQCNEE